MIKPSGQLISQALALNAARFRRAFTQVSNLSQLEKCYVIFFKIQNKGTSFISAQNKPCISGKRNHGVQITKPTNHDFP